MIAIEEDYFYYQKTVTCRIALVEDWDSIKVVDVTPTCDNTLKWFTYDNEAEKLEAETQARLWRDEYWTKNHKPSKYID